MCQQPLVSIIIPCYNAEFFIKETIFSILKQTYQNFEIIIVNDGSIDNSEAIINKISDVRIRHIKKKNSGVSDSRNIGFAESIGRYVLFLDADDVLTQTFIEERVMILLSHPEFDFCCGMVVKIDEHSNRLPGIYQGTFENIAEDILLYKQNIITCPSNYLFSRSMLLRGNLRFNVMLTSTADRFFLIEVGILAKGGFVEDGGELLYRVSKSSMSYNITSSLVNDNFLFYKLLSQQKLIPNMLFNEFSFKMYYILGASYLNLKDYKKGFYFLLKSIVTNPLMFSRKLISKLFRFKT